MVSDGCGGREQWWNSNGERAMVLYEEDGTSHRSVVGVDVAANRLTNLWPAAELRPLAQLGSVLAKVAVVENPHPRAARRVVAVLEVHVGRRNAKRCIAVPLLEQQL